MYKTPLSIELETFKAYKLQRFGFSWFNPKLIWTSLKAAHAAITDQGIPEHRFEFPHPDATWATRLHPRSSAWLLAAQMTCRLAKEKSSYMIVNRSTKKVEGYVLLRPEYIKEQQSFIVPCLSVALFSDTSVPNVLHGREAVMQDSVSSLLRHAFKNPKVAQIKSFAHINDKVSGPILAKIGFEETGTPACSKMVNGYDPARFKRHVLYGTKAIEMGLKTMPS